MKRSLAAMIADVVVAIAAPAPAREIAPFDATAFHAAQSEGQAILVDVYADWCPTCHAQAPTLARISHDPAYDKLVIFRLDYDKQNSEKQALGVRIQGTLIAFHGARETGRAVGITDPKAIEALVQKALK